MSKNHSKHIQYLHEATSSLNTALSLVVLCFWFDFPGPRSALVRMDVAICRYLNLWPNMRVPKDYFVSGYFAFFIPTLALAICLWLVLRLFSRTRIIREFLRSVTGIVALAAAPVWWIVAFGARPFGDGPFGPIQFCEVVLIVTFAILYLFRSRPTPGWLVVLALILHYGFWFLQFGVRPFYMGYGGPVAPTVGFCAALTWVFYLRGRSRVPIQRVAR